MSKVNNQAGTQRPAAPEKLGEAAPEARYLKFRVNKSGSAAATLRQLAAQLLLFLAPGADATAKLDYLRQPFDTEQSGEGPIIETYRLGAVRQGILVQETEVWAEKHAVSAVVSQQFVLASYGLPDDQFFKLKLDGNHLTVELRLREPTYGLVLFELEQTFNLCSAKLAGHSTRRA